MAQAQATAQQRTELLARQLLAAEQANGLVMAPTAGHQHASQVEIPTFSIALPEKLTPDGPWSVYR